LHDTFLFWHKTMRYLLLSCAHSIFLALRIWTACGSGFLYLAQCFATYSSVTLLMIERRKKDVWSHHDIAIAGKMARLTWLTLLFLPRFLRYYWVLSQTMLTYIRLVDVVTKSFSTLRTSTAIIGTLLLLRYWMCIESMPTNIQAKKQNSSTACHDRFCNQYGYPISAHTPLEVQPIKPFRFTWFDEWASPSTLPSLAPVLKYYSLMNLYRWHFYISSSWHLLVSL